VEQVIKYIGSKRSIMLKNLFRMNAGIFLKNIRLILMKDMFGIKGEK
jgi:hypothetical protein